MGRSYMGGRLLCFCLSLSFCSEAFAASQDFDGDGRDDLALYDATTGTFVVRFSSNGAFTPPLAVTAPGAAAAFPVTGQYNAPSDNKSDLAVFDRNTAVWRFNTLSSGATVPSFAFGARGDLPAPADYDGNGCTDLAVYRPSNASWHIQLCGTIGVTNTFLGTRSSVPVPADYDGDGRADVAVFERERAIWSFIRSSDGARRDVQFGLPGDIPVPGNFLGGAITDFVVYRPSNGAFYVRNRADSLPLAFPIGLPGDIPDSLDVDGDGKMDLVTFRPSDRTFNIIASNGSRFVIRWTAAFAPFNSIPNSGRPLLKQLPLFAPDGDYNGDLASDLAQVTLAATGNRWQITGGTGATASVLFGLQTDSLLSGDTDGNTVTEPVVIRPRRGADGVNYLYWYLDRGARGFLEVLFGLDGDRPLLGDFDCDGADDLAVARTDGFYLYWYAGSLAGGQLLMNGVVHGLKGDAVFTADLDGNGCDELVAAREYGSAGQAPGQVVWYALDLASGATTGPGVLWGLTAIDDPLPPYDDDGDGRDDLIVLRTEGQKRTVFIRHWDGTGRTVEVASAITFPGAFSGVVRGEVGSFVAATNRLLISRFDGATNEVPLPQVNASSIVIPSGRAITVGEVAGPAPTGGPGLGAVCSRVTGGGWLWKPQSQDSGGTREGKPMILFSRGAPGGSCLNVYASNGAVVARFGKFSTERFYSGYGCGGGGMSAGSLADKARAAAGATTVYVQGNGGNCYGPIGNPASRTDRR